MHHLYMANGSVNPDLLKNEIIIWGCGRDGKRLYLQLKEQNKEVRFFCDSDERLHKNELYGIPVLSYQQLSTYGEYNLVLAFHQYPEVLDKVPLEMRDNTFADYPFLHNIYNKCIICGENDGAYDRAHFAPFLVDRMFEGKANPTRLMHCRHCGFFYSEYRPDDLEMARLYNNYRDANYDLQRKKYEPDYLSDKYYEDTVVQLRRKGVEEFIGLYTRDIEVKTVLHYGGDSGQFIPQIFSRAEKFVYEISSKEPILGVTLLRTTQEIEKIKWNVILCMMLLEHVSDPMAVMQELVKNMDKTTLLYIEVPCETFMLQYSDIEINEHINFFRESTMEIIADIFKLKIIGMDTDNSGCIRVLYQR